jgi:hypothetical protein
MVREALYETVIGAGLACVDKALETERVALCGERQRVDQSAPFAEFEVHNYKTPRLT